MTLDGADRERLAPYVSSLTDDVFALYGLPEEVIAVLFAYYSRSADDLRTNLAKLLADQELGVAGDGHGTQPELRLATDKARAFHEKWVVGYGHASVAEHAVVHLAVERVSILASKVIEDLRLGSFTEKSTRYVVFGPDSFVDLPTLPAPLGGRYREMCGRLFQTYLDLMPRVTDALRERLPPGTTATAIRGKACDLLRGLLPASTRTNLGLTANARALEGLLSKMLGSPLAEVRGLGEAMHRAALSVTPTLVKYAAPSDMRTKQQAAVAAALRPVFTPPETGKSTMVMGQPVKLVRHDKDALERIALALAYDGSLPVVHASGVLDALRYATSSEQEAVLKAAISSRGRFDAMPRAFEAAGLTVEMLLDFGAYRDLQRHRLLTPATQRLTCRLGFETPRDLVDLGLSAPYEDALLAAYDVWRALDAEAPLEAQYVVPLAYRLRTLWTLNLRELVHVLELRSGAQGHESYRRIAHTLFRVACSVYPWLRDIVRIDLGDHGLARQ